MKMQLHILTPVFLLVSSLFFLFSTDHPLAICGVFFVGCMHSRRKQTVESAKAGIVVRCTHDFIHAVVQSNFCNKRYDRISCYF